MLNSAKIIPALQRKCAISENIRWGHGPLPWVRHCTCLQTEKDLLRQFLRVIMNFIYLPQLCCFSYVEDPEGGVLNPISQTKFFPNPISQAIFCSNPSPSGEIFGKSQ